MDGKNTQNYTKTILMIPQPRAKEKLQQDSRGGEFTFRIKPHSRQRHSEGSNRPVCTRTQGPHSD